MQHRSLKETLQQGFVMGVRMAQPNVTKNLEDFRIMLDRVSMAAKWNNSQKYAWECQGAATCEELLKEENETLENPRTRSSQDTTEDTCERTK